MHLNSLLRISIFAPALTLLFSSANAAEETLVPARFNTITDSRGMRWDLTQNGTIGDGSNDCFDSGAQLRTNQNSISFTRAMMTADGAEYVLSGRTGTLAVTRRVRLDTASAVARYIEIFENQGTTAQTFQAVVHTDLGGNAAQVVDEADKLFSGTFTKDSGAFVAVQNGGRPGVVFVVVEPKGKAKPTVKIEGNRSFEVAYNLTLAPKQSTAVVHYIAQRNGASGTAARELWKQLMKGSRLVDAKIPKPIAGLLSNFNTSAPAGEGEGETVPLLAPLNALAEAEGVARDESDFVVIDAGAKLAGTVTGGDFTMDTEFGKAAVTFAEIAGIAGGGGVQRAVRVYLRTGEIFTGTPTGAKLATATETGLNFEIDLAQIQLLTLRRNERDSVPTPGAAALLTTHRGDCLALAPAVATELQASSPWGTVRVPLGEIVSLEYLREPFPGHRLTLADKSRVFVMLRGDAWPIETTRFGPLKIMPQTVRELRRLGVKVPAPVDFGDAPVLAGGSCELIGENLLAGVIDLPELHLATATNTTPLDPKAILEITRESTEDASEVSVKVKLAEGQELTGRLVESVLPIRSGSRLWRVPAAHLVHLKSPVAEKPKLEEKPPEVPKPDDAAKPEEKRTPTPTIPGIRS